MHVQVLAAGFLSEDTNSRSLPLASPVGLCSQPLGPVTTPGKYYSSKDQRQLPCHPSPKNNCTELFLHFFSQKSLFSYFCQTKFHSFKDQFKVHLLCEAFLIVSHLQMFPPLEFMEPFVIEYGPGNYICSVLHWNCFLRGWHALVFSLIRFLGGRKYVYLSRAFMRTKNKTPPWKEVHAYGEDE